MVAAHAASRFFDRPSPSTFDELVKAAKKAGVEEPVRAAALRFLETGAMPFQVVSPPPAAATTTRPRPSAKKRAASTRPAASSPEPGPPAPAQLKIDPAWPLPMPDYLIPLLNRRGAYHSEPRPHLDVLLEMAMAAKRPDEVLRWYDKMRPEPQRPGSFSGPSGYADRVRKQSRLRTRNADRDLPGRLERPASPCPAIGLRVRRQLLEELRPLYKALDRSGEWTALLASIREKYRNRPRFMEILDGVEGRSIVQSTQSRRK